jgi:hypothetical protein
MEAQRQFWTGEELQKLGHLRHGHVFVCLARWAKGQSSGLADNFSVSVSLGASALHHKTEIRVLVRVARQS